MDAFTTEKKLALIHATPRYLVKSKYLENQNAIKPIIAIVPTGWSTAATATATAADAQTGEAPKSPAVAAGVPQVSTYMYTRPLARRPHCRVLCCAAPSWVGVGVRGRVCVCTRGTYPVSNRAVP